MDGLQLSLDRIEQFANLLVCGLREVPVPQADRVERLGGYCADDLVGFFLELFAGLGGADRNGHDDLSRALLAQGPYRGAHRRASGQAVVDQDDGTAADFGWRTNSAIEPFATLEFLLFVGGHGVNHLLRYA